jgi:hypothetical protein
MGADAMPSRRQSELTGRWSQPRAVWEESGCPPNNFLQAIFTAMG